jgi:aminomethyltransferase
MQSARDWWMPCFYTSIEQEYWNVRHGAGFVDYSFQSAIEVSGPDARDFIQRTIVNDLGRIGPGRALYTNILDLHGVFVDETVIFWMDEDRFILNGGPVPRKHRLLSLLREWSADCSLRIEDLDTCFLALQGPRSREILARAVDVQAMPFMSVRQDRIDDMPAVIARAGYSGELGFEIYVEPGHAGRLWDTLVDLGRDLELGPYGLGATTLLSVEKGLLGPTDFYPGSTPFELGLGWTVALDKGDFNGRTELSRRKRDGLLTSLMGFEVEDHYVSAAPGMRLFQAARPVGAVTQKNVFGPSIGRNVGRCWVETPFAKVGEALELEYLGERKTVRLAGYRHYDPDGHRLRTQVPSRGQ